MLPWLQQLVVDADWQICSLLRGGIGERGGVRVGHRIIEINGHSMVAMPHERIVHLLATSVGEVCDTQRCSLRGSSDVPYQTPVAWLEIVSRGGLEIMMLKASRCVPLPHLGRGLGRGHVPYQEMKKVFLLLKWLIFVKI